MISRLVRTSSAWRWKAFECALAVVVMLGGEFASAVWGQSIAAGQITFTESARLITRPSDQPLPGGQIGEASLSTVFALAVAPDGKTFALSGEDPVIALRDVATNQSRGSLSGHTGPVACLAFAPDGKTLASGGFDETVRLWDLSAKAERTALPGHSGPVLSIAFAPDGKTLASGAQNGAINIWDVADGRKIATLTGHTGPVRTVAFSPNGSRLASAGSDRIVRLWDVKAQTPSSSWQGHRGAVRALAFSPDGKTLATASEDHTVRLWDVATGRTRTAHSGNTDMLLNLAFSPQGKALVAGGYGGKVRVWSPPDAESASILRAHQEGVTALAFNSETGDLLTAGYDRTVKLWSQGARLATLRKSLTIAPRRGGEALFSRDGNSMITSELTGPGAGGIVRVWDTSTWEERGLIEHDGANIFGKFADDGRVIKTGYRGTIRFTDAKRFTPIVTLDIPNRRSPEYLVAPDLSTIIYVDENGFVVIRDLPDLLGTDTGDLLAAFDRKRPRTLFALEPGIIIQQIAYTPDRKSLALITISQPKQLAAFTLYDLSDGHVLMSKSVVGRDFGRLQYSPDGKTLAGAFSNQQEGGDSTLIFWSTTSWEELGRTTIVDSAPTTFMYSPDGSFFATASRQGTLTFWDANTRLPRGEFTAHDGLIVSVYFSPDGKTMATASTTPGEPIKIWDLAGRGP
jgi:WD40 repeat protein